MTLKVTIWNNWRPHDEVNFLGLEDVPYTHVHEAENENLNSVESSTRL